METRLASDFNGSFTTLDKGQMIVMVNLIILINNCLPTRADDHMYWRWIRSCLYEFKKNLKQISGGK